MSSLPIYWQPGDAFQQLGREPQARHWAMAALERDFAVEPLDSISPASLARLDLLVLAQPRALGGAENVALDDWVRAGGQVVVFADPMLVGHTDYAIGDPRRPVDTSLLSPILARWGLQQSWDDAGNGALSAVMVGEAEIAVAHAGWFTLRAPSGGAKGSCELRAQRLAAICSIEDGRVVVFGDATILEDRIGGDRSSEALDAILGMTREGHGPERG